MKLAILGPYPPPIGGISIFIKRFCHFLNKHKIEMVLYNSGNYSDKEQNIVRVNSKILLLLKLLFGGFDVIHSNHISVKSRVLISLFRLLNKKTILTIHGDSFKSQNRELVGTKRKIFIYQIRLYNTVIVVNPDIKKILMENGINGSKILVIPAFIPPEPDEIDIKQLPEVFHQIRRKHKFVITANAFKISFSNCQDLYGIDLSIELMKRLVNRGYKQIGFIFVIPDIGDYDYYDKMKRQVERNGLQECFYFVTRPVAYPAVINMCDLVIRPTNADGYGVSLAEAISLKKPAIASDVCKRPEGTILFKSRDVEDLVLKTTKVIDNYNEEKRRIKNIEFEDSAVTILDMYKRVLNER